MSRKALKAELAARLQRMQDKGYPNSPSSQASVLAGAVEEWVRQRGGEILVDLLLNEEDE